MDLEEYLIALTLTGNSTHTEIPYSLFYFQGFQFLLLESLDDFVNLYFCGVPTLIT